MSVQSVPVIDRPAAFERVNLRSAPAMPFSSFTILSRVDGSSVGSLTETILTHQMPPAGAVHHITGTFQRRRNFQ